MNERDLSKSYYLHNLRDIKNYNHLKYVDSNLLLSSETNLIYYNKLTDNINNINYKYIYIKLLIQHTEIINKIIINIKDLIETNKNEQNIKDDIITLYIIKYQSYNKAFNILSSIKNFNTQLDEYNINNKIDNIRYEMNMTGLEYIKISLLYNNKLEAVNNIDKIINEYEKTHNDELLKNLFNIEYFTDIDSNNNSNNYLLIILLLMIILFILK